LRDGCGRIPADDGRSVLERPGRGALKYREVSMMRGLTLMLLPLLLLSTSPSNGRAESERIYIRFGGGYSRPVLGNLSDELDRQGDEEIKPGYCAAFSIGRTFVDKLLALEGFFSIGFHPDFYYNNRYEGDEENIQEEFTGNLRHYSFALIGKVRLPQAGDRFIPYAGAGLGYGITQLISGGGKMNAFEAVALVQIESRLKDNIYLSIEGSYCTSLSEERLASPHLENVPSDAVYDSFGEPLDDRYSSFEMRIGFTVWLKPPERFSDR